MSGKFYQYNDSEFPAILTYAVSLDLTLTPLYRIHGQEAPALPGLLALAPPRKTARGREQDRLVLYLQLNGTASFSSAEYSQLVGDAGGLFHQTAGPLTSAMRTSANAINQALVERNKITSARGQYAIGWLALLALRDTQCTLMLSGPMQAFLLGQEARHIFEPGLSGKGLGISQPAPYYFTQVTLAAHDRILLTGKVPSAWDSTLDTPAAASLEATRRRLATLTTEDLHCVLMQATTGAGTLSILQRAASEPRQEIVDAATPEALLPAPAAEEEQHPPETVDATPQPDAAEPYPAHMVGPSAYAVPKQEETTKPPPQRPLSVGDFPSSIPRARVKAAEPIQPPVPETESEESETLQPGPEPAPPARARRRRPSGPREPSDLTRKSARAILGGIEGWRRSARKLDESLRKLLPRMLPGDEGGETRPLPDATALFLAMIIPLIVVTIGVVFYFSYGVNQQYDLYLAQAYIARNQAVTQTDPIMQNNTWNEVLSNVDKAESYRKTDQTRILRSEASAMIDQLQGIFRLNFKPALSNGIKIEISRMAATGTELYLLDAKEGQVLRIYRDNNNEFRVDTTFNCAPGQYGDYEVGQLVDIQALPIMSMANATVLGVDANGDLLYCAPNQVPEARPLPTPGTGWGRVTAITMDSGNLYVLDASAKAVWVYTGKSGEFTDLPYFFFGAQVPDIQNGIDLTARVDEIYILHSGGYISHCTYSRIDVRPTSCQELTPVSPYPALRDSNLFTQANFTQMLNTATPDPTLLLLGADLQTVMRFSPNSLELQNQFRPPAGTLRPGIIGAMTTGPDHILYLAVGDQVYFTEEMP